MPLSDEKWKQFIIEKKGITLTVTDKKIVVVSKEALMDEFYREEGKKHFTIEFLTPTSFKSNGRYIIMPDLRLIYQSLMNKYSAFSDMDMYDEETLEQLAANSSISQYRLKSLYFPIERVKIPAFKGEITIKVHGSDTMARYIRLLMRFGEYSGVGIKASMGMGAIRIKEDRQ